MLKCNGQSNSLSQQTEKLKLSEVSCLRFFDLLHCDQDSGDIRRENLFTDMQQLQTRMIWYIFVTKPMNVMNQHFTRGLIFREHKLCCPTLVLILWRSQGQEGGREEAETRHRTLPGFQSPCALKRLAFSKKHSGFKILVKSSVTYLKYYLTFLEHVLQCLCCYSECIPTPGKLKKNCLTTVEIEPATLGLLLQSQVGSSV